MDHEWITEILAVVVAGRALTIPRVNAFVLTALWTLTVPAVFPAVNSATRTGAILSVYAAIFATDWAFTVPGVLTSELVASLAHFVASVGASVVSFCCEETCSLMLSNTPRISGL